VHRPCRAVLDRLYLIATWPVRQALDDGSMGCNEDVVTWSDQLQQYACRLLARVVAELASQVCSSEVGCIKLKFSRNCLKITDFLGIGCEYSSSSTRNTVSFHQRQSEPILEHGQRIPRCHMLHDRSAECEHRRRWRFWWRRQLHIRA